MLLSAPAMVVAIEYTDARITHCPCHCAAPKKATASHSTNSAVPARPKALTIAQVAKPRAQP